MNLFGQLRLAVYLRRIAIAQERIADATEELLALEQGRFEREFPTRFKPKPAEFGVADTQSLNAAWRRDHPRFDGDLSAAAPEAEEGEL